MGASINRWPYLVFFAFPLALALAGFGLSRRVSRTWVRRTASAFGWLGTACLAGSLFLFVPFFWAAHLEARWSAADPATRAEFESCLSLYSSREVDPSESDFGDWHPMRPGDQMIQYLLLWRAPVEVVYDRQDRLIQIYSSYE